MRKNVFGRQFKRDANERKALFKNLLTSLVLQERIMTTEEKAKAIKGAADKLVTKAKKALPAGRQGRDVVYRTLAPEVNHDAVVKLINVLAPRFAVRPGGYTRIIKVGKRRIADNAAMAYLEWSETDLTLRPAKGGKNKKKTIVKKVSVSAGGKSAEKKEVRVSVKTEKKEKKPTAKKQSTTKKGEKKK